LHALYKRVYDLYVQAQSIGAVKETTSGLEWTMLNSKGKAVIVSYLKDLKWYVIANPVRVVESFDIPKEGVHSSEVTKITRLLNEFRFFMPQPRTLYGHYKGSQLEYVLFFTLDDLKHAYVEVHTFKAWQARTPNLSNDQKFDIAKFWQFVDAKRIVQISTKMNNNKTPIKQFDSPEGRVLAIGDTVFYDVNSNFTKRLNTANMFK